MSNQKSSGQERYLATSSASTAFSITAGRTATVPANLIPLGVTLGTELTFFGEGADNSTFDARVWGVKVGRSAGVAGPADYELGLLFSATLTLGTAVGASVNAPVTPSEKLADTCVLTLASGATTPAGPGTLAQTVWSIAAVTAYSPADNTFARIAMRDLGQLFGLVIDFDLTGATAANCLIEQIQA